MTDEMPFYIGHVSGLSPFGTKLFKALHLGKELLRTAFRKDSLPGCISLLNGLERVEFRNCHQLYSCWQFCMQSIYSFLYHYLRLCCSFIICSCIF